MPSQQPKLLLLETTAEICSVGLGIGAELVQLEESDKPFSHNTVLAPSIRSVLELQGWSPGDLSAIVVSAGPGSYTGLRVGISTAKAMSFALDIPMITVETLQAIAQATIEQAGPDAIYCANIDARRMEVYMAMFDTDLNRLSHDEARIIEKDTFDQLIETGNKVVFCGTGTSKCAAVLEGSGVVLRPIQLSAGLLLQPGYDMFVEGRFADIADFKPIYIKAPNITVPAPSR